MANMLGEYGEPMKATEEIQKLCNQVKPEVEKKTKERYEEFIAVKYRQQVVEGMNFLIKVHVGADYDHLLVFRALPCNGGGVELRGVQEHKTKAEKLIPFKS